MQYKRSLLARFTGLGLFRNLYDKFPKQALVTIYKTFIRLHLVMVILCMISHIIKHLVIKLMLQLKGHLGRNSMLKLTLNKLKRCYRKFTCFHKIRSTELPKYLLQLIPTNNHSYVWRKPLNLPSTLLLQNK